MRVNKSQDKWQLNEGYERISHKHTSNKF
jgi:hypothetical protein